MKFVAAATRAVIRHPTLLPAAIGVLTSMARRGWWRRPPFLPRPSAEYVRFRLLTQYGDEDADPTVDDVVSYLRWRRRWPASRARR